MTNDNFNDAARAEAERRYNRIVRRNKTADEWLDEGRASGFTSGAEWARTNLAAQEPTDAECIAVLNAVTTPLGEKPKYTVWFPAAIRRCREAMMSARAARRDEEER